MAQVECPGGCNATLRRARDLFKRALDDRAKAIIAHATDPAVEIPDPPEPVRIAPVEGEPVYCWRCTATIKRELAELEDLSALVRMDADGHRTGPDAERVSGTPAERSLSPSIENLDEMVSVLRFWEDIAVQGARRPRRGFLASETRTVIAQLLDGGNFTRLMSFPRQRPDSPGQTEEFAFDVRQWHRILTGNSKAGTGRHQKNAIPCPRCGRYSLVWIEGEDFVRCSRGECNRPLLLAEYERMVEVWPHVEHTSEVA
ncbi:MAG: hypothetical protein JWO67_6300 [Streptosporangiaceae bacterium]|nr:hypothetical protein [Streptosporangiaceae bacterium]